MTVMTFYQKHAGTGDAMSSDPAAAGRRLAVRGHGDSDPRQVTGDDRLDSAFRICLCATDRRMYAINQISFIRHRLFVTLINIENARLSTYKTILSRILGLSIRVLGYLRV